MEKLKVYAEQVMGKLNDHWKGLPIKRQRRYLLYFFCGYLLITIGVTIGVCYDAGKPGNAVVTRHIENPILRPKQNPALRRDTTSTLIIKKH